jgi:hypothetical protein
MIVLGLVKYTAVSTYITASQKIKMNVYNRFRLQRTHAKNEHSVQI